MAKLEIPGLQYLKSADFNEPRTFFVSKDAERAEVDNPQYGDDEGKSFFYYFVDVDGTEFQFQNNAKGLARAWNDADPNVGDEVTIHGVGVGINRKFTVTCKRKGDAPVL